MRERVMKENYVKRLWEIVTICAPYKRKLIAVITVYRVLYVLQNFH